MVGLWILNTIEPNLRTTMSYAERCGELWADLKERFMSSNAPRKHELKIALVNCKQSDMSVSTYYAKLKKIWDELIDYEQFPDCTCGMINEIIKQREEDKVHQFLIGLDDSIFGTVCSSVLQWNQF